MELSFRRREILKHVIDQFILTGEPVGSKAVVELMDSPCSSATCRNEMMYLEEIGLLEQPHTSAGRVPTARGYRVYVDSLMENYTLSFEETLLLNSLLSDKRKSSQKILQDMTKLLSKMTGYAAIALAREKHGTIERFDGVYINKRSFLLVLITSSGKAIAKQVNPGIPLDPERVAFLIDVINNHLAKKELGGVTLERMIAMEKDLGDYRSIIPLLLGVIYDVTEEMTEIRLSVNGVANLLSFPEFSEKEKASLLIADLEDEERLINKFAQEMPSHVRVHIASGEKGLDSASFVTCPFRLKGGLEGAVCIIGPSRMNYAKAMARLQYLAKEIHAVYGFEPTLPLIETKDK